MDGKTREATCIALASIFGTDSIHNSRQKNQLLTKFLHEGVIKKILPRMVDPSTMVRLHALGALRNITVTGGLDVAEYIAQLDVLSSLHRVFVETTDKHPKILEQAIALLSNLCESSQVATAAVTLDFVASLCSTLDTACSAWQSHSASNATSKYDPTCLQLEMSKFLHIVTDENPPLNSQLWQDHKTMTLILKMLEHPNTGVRLQVAGAILNLAPARHSCELVAKMLDICHIALRFDAPVVRELALDVSSKWTRVEEHAQLDIQYTANAEAQAKVEADQLDIAQAQAVCKKWKAEVQHLSLAMEIVANFVTLDQDMDNEDENDDEEESGMDLQEPELENPSHSSAHQEMLAKMMDKILMLFGQVQHVLNATLESPPGLCASLEEDYARLRTRSCHCLSNMIESISIETLGAQNHSQLFHALIRVYEQWKVATCATEFGQYEVDSVNDFEAAITSLLWAFSRKCDLASSVETALLEPLVSYARESKSIDARVNLVGFFTSLGGSASSSKSSTDAPSMMISTVLMQGLNDPALQVVTEALNGCFDFFAEETYDAAFTQMGFLQIMTPLCVQMKDKIRVEKKSFDRDFVTHVKETCMNLVRFIQYKQNAA